MKTTFRMILFLSVLFFGVQRGSAASVIWNVFQATQSTDRSSYITDPVTGAEIPGICLNGEIAEEGLSGGVRAYMMADVALGYSFTEGSLTWLTPARAVSTLTGRALFALGFARDAITEAYLTSSPLIVDYRHGVGINEVYGETEIPVRDGEVIYLAFMAKGLIQEESAVFSGMGDVYGWVSVFANGNQVELMESAFGNAEGLIIGTGTYATPEPSTALLLLIGGAGLLLRRIRVPT